MRAETITLLPIARYFALMGVSLCHGAGINGAKAPLTGGCDSLWDQQDREDLAQTIATAEEMIADVLGTWPAPKWITNEEIRIGRVRSDWWNAEFQTKWKSVQAFGTQTLTLIDGGAPVTYENRRSNEYGREETAIIGEPGMMYYYPGSCSDVCSVHVFFREADGAWDTADPRWEIRPLTPDVEPPGVVITAESCLFLKPDLQLYKSDFPGGEWWANFEIANLVSEVDVYCESVNTCLPITLYWEGVCTCGTPCAHATQSACAYGTDMDRGHFAPRPATGCNSWTAALYAYPPVRMTVNYKAGWPLDPRTCRMNPRLERAITRLTNVLLPEPPCGFCDAARTRWENDRKDIDPLTPEAASLPWDLYARGALEAWRIIKQMARGSGGSVRGS